MAQYAICAAGHRTPNPHPGKCAECDAPLADRPGSPLDTGDLRDQDTDTLRGLARVRGLTVASRVGRAPEIVAEERAELLEALGAELESDGGADESASDGDGDGDGDGDADESASDGDGDADESEPEEAPKPRRRRRRRSNGDAE